jgi:hypothetical protein
MRNGFASLMSVNWRKGAEAQRRTGGKRISMMPLIAAIV